MDVKTRASDGVLLYMSNPRHVDFIALYLKDGKLNFAFNCGSGAALATTAFTYNDSFWHTVIYIRLVKLQVKSSALQYFSKIFVLIFVRVFEFLQDLIACRDWYEGIVGLNVHFQKTKYVTVNFLSVE